MSNIEPAVQTITLGPIAVPTGLGSSNTQTIDLSQIASLINRRFYRQGINWAVGGFKILSSSGASAFIGVSKLHNTWVTGASWQKTMMAWFNQQQHALEQMGAEDTSARYRDFKIHMDQTHVNAGFANNLIPTYVSPTGEWEASQVVIPNDGAPGTTTEYLLKMLGDSTATAKSIIGGYQFSRSRPQSPDPSTPSVETSWLNAMHDVGDANEDIVENAVDKNANLPYNQVSYPGVIANNGGVQIHDQSYLTGTTIGGTTRLKGGNFPCGLIRFQAINLSEAAASDFEITIQIDLVPGHHRGYLCEPMQEMN